MKFFLITFFLMCGIAYLNPVGAQQRAFEKSKLIRNEEMVRRFVTPTRILWKNGDVKNEDKLLKQGNGQAEISSDIICSMENKGGSQSAILLDFGKEIHGGLQLITGIYKGNKPIKVRIRFGESAAEAMSEIDSMYNATNDHAMRDFEAMLPWMGKLEVGNTGFRFVRIDLLEAGVALKLKEVNAIAVFRDIPYLGSFVSNDTLLNKIWQTGAYTAHLNMQEHLWDGIKRDRLVWIGDMHPETSTIAAVFGNNEVVPKSLDLVRDLTPLPDYMNGISSYSMWWVIIQKDWYMHNGDLEYLKKQKQYLSGLLNHFAAQIDDKNSEKLTKGWRFLDWPTSDNPEAIHGGLQAMLLITLEAGAELSIILGDQKTAEKCLATVKRLKTNVPDSRGSKQVASLLSLSGLLPPKEADKIISAGGVKDFSTFYGFYMLKAKAKAGNYKGGIDNIREFWGAMLNLGATSFWEDFNMDWIPNAGRIDELVPKGKIDLHAKYGSYSYKGYRNSLAHGWASGPTAWLTENVLGVKIMAPGCRIIKIEPHLGDLKFVEGSFPTPLGIVKIKHTKIANGTIKSDISAPKGIKIIK